MWILNLSAQAGPSQRSVSVVLVSSVRGGPAQGQGCFRSGCRHGKCLSSRSAELLLLQKGPWEALGGVCCPEIISQCLLRTTPEGGHVLLQTAGGFLGVPPAGLG